MLSYKVGELTGESLSNSIASILEMIRFMSGTANEFRDFYKPSKAAELFCLFKQIDSVLRLLRKQLELDGIAIVVSGEENIHVLGYASEFKQVILNIINNAKDAVTSTKLQEPKIEITISAQDEKGTGIGLSLSKTIIEDRMGGKISACNADGGTEFKIELPIAH